MDIEKNTFRFLYNNFFYFNIYFCASSGLTKIATILEFTANLETNLGSEKTYSIRINGIH